MHPPKHGEKGRTLTKEQFYFEGVSNEALEVVYDKFQTLKDAAGCFTPDGKMFSDCGNKVYEELKRRGEEHRGLFLILRRNLASIDAEELQEFHRKLEIETMKQHGTFEGDFTPEGDPITDTAGIICNFIWFLEVELQKRGIEVR